MQTDPIAYSTQQFQDFILHMIIRSLKCGINIQINWYFIFFPENIAISLPVLYMQPQTKGCRS